jgi:arylsulfatase A-like enzyme
VAPGVTTANTICKRTIDFMSIYPTLCALTGIEKPAHVTGENIIPLLRDANAAWSVPALCTYGYQNHAVRSEHWRYIHYANGDEELYDEMADPYEWTNVANKPEHASLKAELFKFMPTDNMEMRKGNGKGKSDD